MLCLLSLCTCGVCQLRPPSRLIWTVLMALKRRKEPAGAGVGKAAVGWPAETRRWLARIILKGTADDIVNPPQCQVLAAQCWPAAFCSTGGPQPLGLSGV